MAELAVQSAPAAGRRWVIGIADAAVSNQPGDVLVTHALGSCIAVCIWDPVVRVAGMLHFLLPESKINAQRAREQPSSFADTGIPLLFRSAYEQGLQKSRTIVRLVGGAEISGGATSDVMKVGRRNILSAKNVLWRNGVLIQAEDVGGLLPRTVTLGVDEGRLLVSTAGAPATTL